MNVGPKLNLHGLRELFSTMPGLKLVFFFVGLVSAIVAVGGVEPSGLLLACVALIASAAAQLRRPPVMSESARYSRSRYTSFPLIAALTIIVVGIVRCSFDPWVFSGLLPDSVKPSLRDCSITALPTLAGICLGIIVFWIAWGCGRREKRAIGYFLYLALCFELIYGIYAFNTGSISVLGIGDRSSTAFVTGTFGNRNNYGVFISMTTPIAIAICVFSRWLPLMVRVLGIVLITLLVGVALISSASRLGIASFFFGLMLWSVLSIRQVHLWTRARRMIVAVAFVFGVLIVGVWFGPEVVVERYAALGSERIVRLQLWSAALELPLVAWLFGIGVGRFEFVFPLVSPSVLEHKFYYLHNDLLQFVLEFGLAGTLTLLIGLCLAVRTIEFKNLSYVQVGAISGVGAGLLASVGDFPLHIPGIGLTFCALLGIAVSLPLSGPSKSALTQR